MTTSNDVTFLLGGGKLTLPVHTVLRGLLNFVDQEVLDASADLEKAPGPHRFAIPPVREYWPGQGGRNGGLFQIAGQRPYFLIVPHREIAQFNNVAWGSGDEPGALSDWDGAANTKFLVDSESSHPAAEKCAAYIGSEGHTDHYLAARHEMRHLSIAVPDLFDPEKWYQTSTQHADDSGYAWCQDFSSGTQDSNAKRNELVALPVRRFYFDHLPL